MRGPRLSWDRSGFSRSCFPGSLRKNDPPTPSGIINVRHKMNAFGFLFDGGNWSSWPPPVPMMLCVCLAPVAALVGCYLVARKRQFVGYAVGIASLSALVLVAPMHRVLFNSYDKPYRIADLLVLLFAIAFPFLAIAVFYFYPPKKPNQSAQPTQASGPRS